MEAMALRNDGKHSVSPQDKKRALEGDIVKCSDPNCDTYVRYTREFDDNYFVEEFKKRE